MLEYILVILATVIISSLTFLSGFGLGTLLLPIFILFLPINTAVAATAVVHLANNIFKACLTGNKSDMRIVWQFSLPGAIFAIIGAFLLSKMVSISPIYNYQLFDYAFWMTPIKLLVASLMLVFCIVEFLPVTKNLTFDPKFVPVGGALSGFFGGLSGHQGALRAAFLVRLGLDKETFIGTTILSAIVIDCSRLLVYGITFFSKDFNVLMAQGQLGVIIAGVVAAFMGAVAGNFFIKKVSMELIHQLIGYLLILYSIALGLGLI